jgi:hypothetical protein
MSGALNLRLWGVKMMGQLRFKAEDEKGETATHFLALEERCGMAQDAVVMWPQNGIGGCPRQHEEDKSPGGPNWSARPG